jgi:sulfite dehydrogenase
MTILKNLMLQRLVCVIISLIALCLRAAPVEIRLPPEVAVFKQDAGVEIANAQCLVCHSVEYVTIQPPLPRSFWKGSIQKMQQKYGASIPEQQVEPLADYLTRNYGAATNNAPRATLENQPQATQHPASLESAPNVQEVAARYGCSACHNASVRIIGPSLREIASKYKHDPEAKKKIEEQIHNGGSGKWGPMIMPPFPQATAVETKILTDWILNSDETK